MPHKLIKDTFFFIWFEEPFQEKILSTFIVMRNMFFFASEGHKYCTMGVSSESLLEAFVLFNIIIQFGTKLYQRIVGIPLGTKCAPLIADLFLFTFWRLFYYTAADVNAAWRR